MFLLAAWFVSPAVMWFMGRPAPHRSRGIDDRQRLFLRKTARRTWEYFARFVGPEHHWLPPDNFQQDPPIGEATRTSPTNMGMALLGNLAAWDFGYVSVGTLLDRTRQAFRTMEELPRHRGHFLNWYRHADVGADPSALRVNGGQRQPCGLSGRAQGGTGGAGRPPHPAAAMATGVGGRRRHSAGGTGSAGACRHTCIRTRRRSRARADVHGPADGVPAIGRNRPARGIQGTVRPRLGRRPTWNRSVEPESEIAYWLGAVRRQSEDLRTDLVWLAPWLPDSPHQKQDGRPSPFQDSMPSLRDLASPAHSVPTAPVPGGDVPEPARERAAQRMAAIEDLAERCGEMSDMDLDFLYDPDRKLLSIGYDVDDTPERPGLLRPARVGGPAVQFPGHRPRPGPP